LLGVVVLALIYLLFSSLFVVNEREQAIVMRFGEITREIHEPGLYFKIPTSIVDSGADHRRSPVALRYDQPDAAGFGRQVLRSRRVRDLQDHQSAPVP
jgi:regulator of protease activity HflC (stomatin/prohibitin superfamily)